MAIEIPGYCTLCRSRCGTLNTVENGRLIKVAPLPGHPTGRAVCAKGRAAPELAHSSRRLTQPLKRTTPKGSADPGWQPISWEEALDEIAARLGDIRQRHGAEAVAFALTSPSATPMVDSVEWVERFIQLFGSPNVCNATEICNWQKDVAHGFTFGTVLPLPDYAHTDLIILWGHNPSSVWLAQAGELAEAQRRGARLAVIDPRRTGHAGQADHWLAVRPGTDAALALGLAHRLIAAGRFDRDFVRAWTNGPLLVRADNGRFLRMRDIDPQAGNGDDFAAFDEAEGRVVAYDRRRDPEAAWAKDLALTGTFEAAGITCRPAFDLYAARCADYPVERVAAITGVDAGTIVALADAIAQAKAVSHFAWTGIGQHANSTQTSRAMATLYALTGCFDAKGGNVVPTPLAAHPISQPALLSESQRLKALGARERPIGPAALGMVTARELYTAILDAKPYRVRALMTFGTNMLLSRGDAMMGRKALQALDFAVHCDLFDNPTAQQADILLPVGSPWEREGLKLGFDVTQAAQELVQLRPAMIPRVGQSRSDAEIVCDLAQRLGFADRMFGGDIEAGWRHRLAPLGLTLDALRAHPAGIRRPLETRYRKYAENGPQGIRGFATETGRVELYSELMLRHGQAPLPAFEDHADAPLAAGNQRPFILTCAKSPYYCHSQHRQAASLRRRAREPMVTLAGSIADARTIAEGTWVEVSTRAGKARFKATIDRSLARDVAVADFGWWRALPDLGLPGYDPFSDEGSNFNRLIDADHADPVSGAPSLKSFACDIRPVATTGVSPWRGQRRLRVAARRQAAGGIVELELSGEDGGPLPPFRPGQHLPVSLDIPGSGPVERSYSLCGDSRIEGAGHYRIAIKPIAGDGQAGLFSSFSAASLGPGSRIDTRMPAGDFVIPEAADFPVVLIAAGIGITPFLGYLHALRRAPSPPRVTLHYGSRNAACHAFGTEIASLAAALPSLDLVTHFSRPDADDTCDAVGRIDAESIGQDLIDGRARFYLCGPEAMIADITQGLIRRGVPAFEIFSEAFVSPPRRDPASGEASRFAVTFARSGRIAIWSPERGDLLRFSEELGLSPPSGCRVGQCESCALTVLDGVVTHLVPATGLDAGQCLSCQAVPASDLVLDA